MWAVPCFLMITGSLLLNKEKEVATNKIRKYITRVMLALICFSFLYQTLSYIYEDESNILKGWFYNLFSGQSWAHLWYLYLMVGIYLMIPFYKMIINQISEKQLVYLFFVLIFFISILPLSKLINIQSGFYIPTSIIYPLYIFLGYYYGNKKTPRWLSIILILVSTVTIVALTIVQVNTRNESISELLLGYSSILVIVQTIGIFNLILSFEFKENYIIKVIDDNTFGIYLIHMIFIRAILKWYGLNPYIGNGLLFIFSVFFISFIMFMVSLCISYSIRKITKEKLL